MPFVVIPRFSEQQLQRKLELPGRSRGTRDDARRRTRVIPLEYHLAGFCKVHVVQNVERLRPELQAQLLIDADPLEERCVDHRQRRSG